MIGGGGVSKMSAARRRRRTALLQLTFAALVDRTEMAMLICHAYSCG